MSRSGQKNHHKSVSRNERFHAWARIAAGGLSLSAVVYQFITGFFREFDYGNYFSFFTIEANIYAGTILLLLGAYTLRGRDLGKLQYYRGAAVLYMTITGIVYVTLLSGLEDSLQTPEPWVNIILHYFMPAFILIDWLISPPRAKIPFSRGIAWLAFPVIWLVYTMVRGPITGWYPYPFLNPTQSGYGSVVVTCVVILLSAVVLIWLLLLRIRNRKLN